MVHELLEQAEFVENPEPRCPLVLLLDTSGSMSGQPIAELNKGLQELERALKKDRLASLRVEVALITFGGSVQLLDPRGHGTLPLDAGQAFITADSFRPPQLQAGGDTPMGEAVRNGLRLLRERKETYKQNGIEYYRPWIFLLSDGHPTDAGWEAAASEANAEEARKGVMFFTVGVENADMQKLARFSTERTPLKLRGLAFEELFNWLSRSLSAVSHSNPGDLAPLPPVGWAQIDTSH
ncbi:MAG: VWA domain-containing protein [Chloroflexota bacterium]|nr:VWA domain-containing protein [Chloroflexota bacterium]